ncbi:hypothetical protein P3S67_003844 [Capsicum chacoense]
MTNFWLVFLALSTLLTAVVAVKEEEVNITILHSAITEGAVCLDASPPAYHLDMGYGTGFNSWIITIDGGDWCDCISYCYNRSTGLLGSSTKMQLQSPSTYTFGGILRNNPRTNPDFYNWKRVMVRYCDGSSFTGDVAHVDPETKVYYGGARIFKAIMDDLSQKGMQNAENAILSGTSAGGLSTILNCDRFKSFLPENARVKCVGNAGFFINAKTVSGTFDTQEMFNRVVNLHEAAKNLPPLCTSAMEPSLCFFPQNVVPYVQTPLFIINSAYDSWQLWMKTLEGLGPCFTTGYFITSCHTHAKIMWTDYWFAATSPRKLNKTIAEAVGD